MVYSSDDLVELKGVENVTKFTVLLECVDADVVLFQTTEGQFRVVTNGYINLLVASGD